MLRFTLRDSPRTFVNVAPKKRFGCVGERLLASRERCDTVASDDVGKRACCRCRHRAGEGLPQRFRDGAHPSFRERLAGGSRSRFPAIAGAMLNLLRRPLFTGQAARELALAAYAAAAWYAHFPLAPKSNSSAAAQLFKARKTPCPTQRVAATLGYRDGRRLHYLGTPAGPCRRDGGAFRLSSRPGTRSPL